MKIIERKRDISLNSFLKHYGPSASIICPLNTLLISKETSKGPVSKWFTLLHLDGLFMLLSSDLVQKIFKYAFTDPHNAVREPENKGSRHTRLV